MPANCRSSVTEAVAWAVEQQQQQQHSRTVQMIMFNKMALRGCSNASSSGAAGMCQQLQPLS